MNRLKFYRISLWIALFSAVAALGIYGYWYMKTQVPDQIRVSEDENQTLYLGVKEVSVRVVKRQRVIPGGIPVGLYLETQGVYVVGTDKIEASDGLFYEPAEQVVYPGDYILAVNGRKITDKKELIACVQANRSDIMILKLRRNKEEIQVRLQAVKSEDQEYKLGIWVKDDIQGIGTLTYMTQDDQFGALGHGITDSDTRGITDNFRREPLRYGNFKDREGKKRNTGGSERYDYLCREVSRRNHPEKYKSRGIWTDERYPGKKIFRGTGGSCLPAGD